MNPQPSSLLSTVLGLWLGATLTILVVVAWNFAGMDSSMKANSKLQEATQFDFEDRAARRAQPVFVFAGELNRHLLYGFNRAQLILGGAALLIALSRYPRRSVVLALVLSIATVLALTFYLGPQIEQIGRSIDFVPESESDERFARFQRLHDIYVRLEGFKTLSLLVASVLCMWKRRES